MNMQEIQPKLEYLQKKYKSNPEKMNEEVMKLYKEYNVNPDGCLPFVDSDADFNWLVCCIAAI